MSLNPIEMIHTAAIKVYDVVWTLPRPTRHHTLIQAWSQAHYKDGKNASIPDGHEQGFVTNYGDYVGREEAANIAYLAGQIKEPKKTLFSEDLWRGNEVCSKLVI